jgi:hypothetical protein
MVPFFRWPFLLSKRSGLERIDGSRVACGDDL